MSGRMDNRLMPTSGTDLKVERTRARVKLQDLAARMGVSRQTLWSIEQAAVVRPDRAEQYQQALATFDDVETPETAEVYSIVQSRRKDDADEHCVRLTHEQ